MPHPLRVLLLEDSALDAELILAQLREDGFAPTWTRVESEEGFRAELKPELDLILCDYQMPQFTALRALEVLRESGLTVPLIIVSGTIGEDMAVAAMKEGASDYLLKDRLVRLGQAVERVLEQHRWRRERMEAEAALRESEERFRQVVESIHEVFWMTDVEHREMLYISPGYETIWGRPTAHLIKAPNAWLDAIHPEDRERVAEAMRTKQATGEYDETYRIVRPDGSVRWIRDRAFPVQRNGEPVTRVAGVAEDVTERKLLEAQFLRAQRMEAIGTLASGVAHDLNNILAPMLMAASLLKESVSDARDREMLQMVERSAERGADLIRQLLSYSRGMPGARVPVQPKHLLREVEGLIRETFPREIKITFTLKKDLWPVVADATQLHQVMMNLCVNARDAMPEGGTLKVSAQNVEFNDEQVARWPGARPGPFVAIRIEDTGTGIAPENLPRIFNPFFTTKEVGKGTGIGLSTAFGIVNNHGGFITVDSRLGEGTAFDVYLPVALDSVAPEAAAGEKPAQRGEGEVILVVDDEEPIREATRHVLMQNGYRVVTAVNGRHALTVFLAHRNDVKLVITDVMMPEMGGGTLARALRVLAPGLKILATSGLEADRQHREFASLGGAEILQKPCGAATLLDAVRRTLDQRGR